MWNSAARIGFERTLAGPERIERFTTRAREAIVDASIKQMEAYAELIANVVTVPLSGSSTNSSSCRPVL